MPKLTLTDIQQMGDKELRDLNHMIVEVIRARNSSKQKLAGRKFSIGDPVFFVNKGRKITGKVKKVNPKTIHVTPDDNQFTVWRVSPTLLTPVK